MKRKKFWLSVLTGLLVLLVIYVGSYIALVVREGTTADEGEATSLNDRTDVTLHVGSRVHYNARDWSSVGYKAECSVSDEKVIRLATTRLVRLHPWNPFHPWDDGDGGDEARKVFCFEAVSKGKTVITIRKLFRGKLQETTEIKITVRE
jgi:hypothetical protein